MANEVFYPELERLQKDEGFRERAYADTSEEKLATAGYGFNLEKEGAQELLDSLNIKKNIEAIKNNPYSPYSMGKKGLLERYKKNPDEVKRELFEQYGEENPDHYLTKEESLKLMRHEMPLFRKIAREFVGDDTWKNLDTDTQGIFVNMAYNLGEGKLRGFGGLQRAIRAGDRELAAKEMWYQDPRADKLKETDWFGQVGDRSKRLISRMWAPYAKHFEKEKAIQLAGRMAGGGTVQAARGLAALGRGPDNQLVHMAPKEVAALQRLATAAGGSLTVNPETGLVEAGFLEDWLPTIIGLGLAPFTGGLSTFLVPAAAGVGATAITGDWKQGLKWGLGVSGGMGLGSAFGAAGAGAAGVDKAAGLTVAQGGAGPLAVDAAINPVVTSIQAPGWGSFAGSGVRATMAPGASVGSIAPGVAAQPTIFPQQAVSKIKAPGWEMGFPKTGNFAGQVPLTAPSPINTPTNYLRGSPTIMRDPGPITAFDPTGAAGSKELGLFDPKRWSAERWKEGMGRFGDNITSKAGWKDAWQSGKLKMPLAGMVASGGLGAYGRSLEEFEEPEDTSDKPAGYPEDAPYGYIAPRRDVMLPQRPAGDTSEMSYFDPSPYPNPMGYVPYDPTDERFYAAGGGLVNLPKYQEGGTVAATPDVGEVSYQSSFTGARTPSTSFKPAPFQRADFNPTDKDLGMALMVAMASQGGKYTPPASFTATNPFFRPQGFGSGEARYSNPIQLEAPAAPIDGGEVAYFPRNQGAVGFDRGVPALGTVEGAGEASYFPKTRAEDMHKEATGIFRNTMMLNNPVSFFSYYDIVGRPRHNIHGGFTTPYYPGLHPKPVPTVPARQFMAAGGPVEGAGDGTSDSVPAKIDDQQPAALSTGEFVISADVVSGLGNGDTDAGAEQLYALMDRVRSKRSNGVKQPPTIRPRGLMPA